MKSGEEHIVRRTDRNEGTPGDQRKALRAIQGCGVRWEIVRDGDRVPVTAKNLH